MEMEDLAFDEYSYFRSFCVFSARICSVELLMHN